MSKYCMQCGKEIENNDVHCPFCGASQESSFGVSPAAPAPDAEPQKGSSFIVPVVAVIALILVVLIVFMNLTIFNNGFKAPIDNVVEALNSGDADYLEDALPDFIVEDDRFDHDELESELKKLSELSDLEISYKVKEKEELSGGKLDRLEDSIKEEFDESVDVENGYEIKMDLDIKVKDSSSKSENVSVEVYEIDGDWCLISIDDFLSDLD